MAREPGLSLENREYLGWLMEGGFDIKRPASDSDTMIDTSLNLGKPPWETQKLPEDLDTQEQIDDYIAETTREAVKQAVFTANRAVFLIENAEAEKKRAEFHAARVVVISIQKSLKRKMEHLQKMGGPGSAFKIATTEAFLNETARDYQDLSIILQEDKDAQHRKNVERLG